MKRLEKFVFRKVYAVYPTSAVAFAVHYFHYNLNHLVESVGSVSGREVDKFKEFGIKHFLSPLNNPIIESSVLALDCYYIEHYVIGDHTLIVGEIKGIYYNADYVFVDGDYVLLRDKRTVLYSGKGEYITVDLSSAVNLRNP